jgi:predicted dehydrogenase
VQVIAVADKSKKGLAEAKARGVKQIYKDYKELLDKASIDAVIISLPNFLHEESICLAAERGLDIFVEKPLARNVEEGKRIKRSIEKNGIFLAIGHNYRYFNHVRQLKLAFDSGSIGDVEIANLEHFVNGPFAHPLEPVRISGWWLDRELSGGGVLLDQGSHLIDLFQWFFPEPELIHANIGYRFSLAVEDSAVVILRSRVTSTIGVIMVGWFEKMIFPQFDFRICFHGTAGFRSTDDFVPSNMYLNAAKEAIKNVLKRIAGRPISPLSYTYYYNSYFKELRAFLNQADGTRSDLADPEDSLRTLEIIEEAYRKAKSKNNE